MTSGVGSSTARGVALPALCLVLLAACALGQGAVGGAASPTRDGPSSATPGRPVDVTGRLEVAVLVDGLEGPTQAVLDEVGRWWIAELGGAEDAREGRVSIVEEGTRTVVLEGLDKPTGLAVTDGALWVVERRRLSRAPRDGTEVGPLDAVRDDLPFNGRSLGTLTQLADGRLLYDTSGALDDGEPVPGSGVLWILDPTEPGSSAPFASGFKHAYAHVQTTEGRIFATEVGDDPVDGGQPPDEVNEISPGTDGGWPTCAGNAEPVARYAGTAAACAQTLPPVALLPAGATPTGIAVDPFHDDALLVSLFTRGEILRVPITDDATPVAPVPVLREVAGPMTLVTDGEELVLVEHLAGRLLGVTVR